MTIFTKLMTTAVILSAVGIASSAHAQDVDTPKVSETPAKAWLLTIVPTQKLTGLQPVKADRSQAWTVREPLILAETPEEKYVRTDLSNFSYPVLGPIAYGVRPDPAEVLTSRDSYPSTNVVSSSFGSNPYDVNTFENRQSTSAQLLFKF